MAESNGQVNLRTDYDLHGIVGIRLLNAAPADAAAVTRQLGPIQTTLNRDPDIIIRFVDKLPISAPMHYLGVDDVAFTDDAFLVLRSKHKARSKVQIPFEQIGGRCEIVCERGLPAVPLLIPVVNLTALSKRTLPMHASAFTYNGIGTLVTGWAKGGKTETLLAFMAKGAKYIGDEWIYISEDGQRMYGIPEPIRIWDWQLEQLPQYWALIGRSNRTRLRGLNSLAHSMDWAVSSGLGRGSGPVKLIGRVSPLIKQQLYVQMPPERLFNQEVGSLVGNLNKLFFVASHEANDTVIEPIDPQEVARRMVFSLQEERKSLVSYYWKYRFAFPESRNPLIDQAEEIQRKLLERVLSGKETYAVFHPYPVSIPSLFDALNPLLGEGT